MWRRRLQKDWAILPKTCWKDSIEGSQPDPFRASVRDLLSNHCPWDAPIPQRLAKTAFTGSRKLYFVFTSDAYAGISGFQGKLLARRRRMKHVGRAEFKNRATIMQTMPIPNFHRAKLKSVSRMPLHACTLSQIWSAWAGSCFHCMAWIKNCSVGAIEYGQITQGMKRYRFEIFKYTAKEN